MTKPGTKHAICEECRKLGGMHAVVRYVLRFAEKYYAAKLLHARMFSNEEAVRLTEDDIRASVSRL